jgi:hypothetical protein
LPRLPVGCFIATGQPIDNRFVNAIAEATGREVDSKVRGQFALKLAMREHGSR